MNNPTRNGGASITFIADVGGLGIEFAGLAEAPRTVENGLYAGLLFGILRGGTLYAFDTSGNLHGAFVDGKSSIQITNNPNSNVTGLAFSNLQTNLWNVTARGAARPVFPATAPNTGFSPRSTCPACRSR